MPERCQVIQLDITGDQIDQSVKDPALAALVADGWTVGADLVTNVFDAEGKSAGQKLTLILVPPPEPKGVIAPVVSTNPMYSSGTFALAVAINVSILTVIAWIALS